MTRKCRHRWEWPKHTRWQQATWAARQTAFIALAQAVLRSVVAVSRAGSSPGVTEMENAGMWRSRLTKKSTQTQRCKACCAISNSSSLGAFVREEVGDRPGPERGAEPNRRGNGKLRVLDE